MLLTCTYVNDFTFQYLNWHLDNFIVVVPALHFALLLSSTDMPLPNTHLEDIRTEPRWHTQLRAQHSAVALQLPYLFDVAELLPTQANLPHSALGFLFVFAPIQQSPTCEFSVSPDRTVLVVARMNPQCTVSLAQPVRHVQDQISTSVICPAYDC